MRGAKFLLFACPAVLALAAGGGRADTVVLKDGARLSGTVAVAGNGVTIRSSAGTLSIPAWRVAIVEREGQAAEAPPAQHAAAPQRPAVPASVLPEQAASVRPGSPAVADVLGRKLDVDLEGVPVDKVLEYVREMTGVNMAVSAEVKADAEPVYLRLKAVSVEVILELVLEPRGFCYSVRPGEILFVHKGAPGGDAEARVYEVSDLLLSREDQVGGGGVASRGQGAGLSAGGGAGGGGRSAGGASVGGGGLSPQFGAAPGGAAGGGAVVRAGGGGRSGGYTVPLSARAGQLILLIKGTCGEGTWMDPASTGVLGGRP